MLSLCLAVEEHFSLTRDRIFVGGFSQGAMLSIDAGLHSTQSPFAGLLSFSGGDQHLTKWEGMLTKVPKPPIFLSHGGKDPSYQRSERLYKVFKKARFDVTFARFRGEHVIPEEILVKAADFMQNKMDEW
jgi:phospholipase/carboxylesterase